LAAESARATMTGDEARRQVARALTVAAESALRDIQAALCRLDRGTYGFCERCAGPIPIDRLEILPMSRWCMPCHKRGTARTAPRL
jgi:DnaK suppressor protein